MIAGVPAFAGPDGDPFSPANKAESAGSSDPFDLANKAGPAGNSDPFDIANKAKPVKMAKVQPNDNPQTKTGDPKNPKVVLSPSTRAILERIQFTARVEPQTVQPGQPVKLIITGRPKGGVHTYAMTKRTPQQLDGQLSYLQYAKNQYLKPLERPGVSETPPVRKIEGDQALYEHDKEFTWSQDILVLPETPQGEQTLRFEIKLQACTESNCVSGSYPPQEVRINVKGSSVPLTPELQERLQAKPTGAQVVDESGVWGFVLVSMGAAFLMLLTPCVFPMIPITVSFFLKQSEKEHHNALASAGVYSSTIIVVLTLAVFLLGKVVIDLANDPWLNLGLGVVLIFFALSLFGMYDIELPSFLARFTSAREGKGGMAGPFFMALTFTITSFTCTGPFLGPLLAGAAELKPSYEKLILGALAYSVVFAAPFFVLALFPKLLKTLPKSGGWLNAIKVVMGFLEFAAALKFIANTDLAWNPGDALFFTYETVLCAWIALSLACGLYLFGLFRLPHDSPEEHIGVVRMLFASLFVGLAVYMTPALWRVTPQGIIGKGLVAFLPLDTRLDMDWTRDLDEAWADATQGKEVKLIFIDFTGQNCTNCRYNEKNVFTKPSVRDLMKDFVRVQLYTDRVPEEGLTAGESEALGKHNQRLQEGTFNDVTNPYYAIVKPEKGKKPFTKGADGKLKLNGTIIGTRSGLIPANKVKQFVNFLKDSLNEQQAAK
jgi:thiol:disulfide interchange protein DsbD